MKRNKIMALAMLCSTLLSPVSKAHGGTKQGTEKSDTLENVKNKKSDNSKEMYESRWKTDGTVRWYIEYFFGTVIGGGVLGYGGKKVYNKYIRNPKIKKIKPEKIIEEIKKIEPKEELTKDSIAKKIKEELTKDSIAKKIKKVLTIIISTPSKGSKRMRRVYKQVVKAYESQNHDEFKKAIETEIPEEERDEKQFITLFRELDDDTINILLEDLTNEEQKFAKDNFKFYSFVWVEDASYIVIAFAPKEKEIDLEGKRGKEAFNFDDKQLFGKNFGYESYNEILKYCEINK